MLAIPLICVLADGVALSADTRIDPGEAAAVLSAVESGFGEQAASAAKLISIAAIFAGEGQIVIVSVS
ncbi:MAG: hypothetical protein M3Z54_02890 [Gemmatimonadota bacterium]|nr:hypothetical protein [Gemmatimonadota bacterium]